MVGVVHSVIAIKSTVIAFATDLAWWIRSLVGACSVVGSHIGVGLLIRVALVEVLEGTRPIWRKVAIVVSW